MTQRSSNISLRFQFVDDSGPAAHLYNLNTMHLSTSFRDACRVTVPARTSVSVLDMNGFSLGEPGGGNLGFALDWRTSVHIARSPDLKVELSASTPPAMELLVRHCLSIWTELQNDEGCYLVGIDGIFPVHVGLASSGAVQTAIYLGLNWLNGLPLSERQVADLMGANYREIVDGALRKGFTTGLSCVLNCFGGFALVDCSQRVEERFSIPGWSYVFGSVSTLTSRSFGDEEARVLMGSGREFDQVDRVKKRDVIGDVLIPALRSRDLKGTGIAIGTLQSLGSKRAELAIYGTRGVEALDTLHRLGVECCFLSAVGPGILAISTFSCEDLLKRTEKAGINVLRSGILDSVGATIESIVP